MAMLHLTHCPTCGSPRIKKVRRTVMRECRGQKYTVPGLQFHECPDCGERVYDPEAMRKIQAYRSKVHLRTCPTCGNKAVRPVKRTVTRRFQGKPYEVPDLEFEECQACKERLYGPQAMRKIEAHSPAYAKRRPRARRSPPVGGATSR